MSARSREHGRRAVLLFAVLMLSAVSGWGGEAGPPEVRAVLGIGGWVVPGKFAPLRIDVRSEQPFVGTLRVDVPAAIRGGLPVTHVVPLQLPAGGRSQIHLDVIVHDPRRPLVVTGRDARGEQFRYEVPVGLRRVVEGVVAALSHEAAGLEFLGESQEKRRPAYLSEADLPVAWQAYEAVDLLIVRDLDARAVLPPQERALTEWISQGGRLLVVAPQRLNLGEARWLRELLPPVGARGYGLGLITVTAEDLFTPARRARGELRSRVATLLRRQEEARPLDVALADVLPKTRPLSGGTQFGLGVLSLLYILAVRVLLRRVGAVRGGWMVIAALVGISTGALYATAAGARTAATSLAQLSVAEVLGTLDAARVTTYASVIAPYGGRFVVAVPDGVSVRPPSDAAVAYDVGARRLRGTAEDGQLSLIARQIVSFRLHARRVASGAVSIGPGPPALQDAVLYRQRQLYRLPADPTGTVRLDPGRWEPVDRQGTLGTDRTGRAMDLVFRRLDRLGDATWLVGRITDDRLGLRTDGGASGDAVSLVVAVVR